MDCGGDVLLRQIGRIGHVVGIHVTAAPTTTTCARIGVNTSVTTEFVLPVEASAAVFARIRTLSRMNHLMPSQVILLRERSAADITMEWLVSGMCAHVIQ